MQEGEKEGKNPKNPNPQQMLPPECYVTEENVVG